MTFLNPIGWTFLGLAPVLVLLYLRRVRRRSTTVSSLLFWEMAMGETARRAWFGRLRQWLSLLLQLFILLLLILAFVRPEPWQRGKAGESAGVSTVVVIDARARMQAVEPGGETRFAKALNLARQTAASARENATVAVILARPAPEVIAPFTASASTLRSSLAHLSASDAGGELTPALALARELVNTRAGRHRIVLITDRPESPTTSGDVEIASVGSPLENVAITQFAARPQIASPQTADLFLELCNFGKSSMQGNVEISCDGTLLDVKPFSLAAGERKTDVFPALPMSALAAAVGKGAATGRITAHLDTHDALPLDDTAYALLPSDEPRHILLVSKGNWFLEKSLAADGTLQFETVAPEKFQPALARKFDAVIYDGVPSVPLEAVEGNALFLKSGPLASRGTLDQPLVTDSDPKSPLLRFVQWRTVNFQRASQFEMPGANALVSGWKFEAPLRSFDHALILTATRHAQESATLPASAGQRDQRLALFAFDMADSDLPLRIGFPLLISNTLHWLAGGNLEDSGVRPCGSAIELAADETANPEPVRLTETGLNPTATAPMQRHGFLAPERNGFYQITKSNGTSEAHRWLAVNTFSDDESSLAAREGDGTAKSGGVGSTAARFVAASWPLWQWLTLAGIAVLTLEWWFFHRRRTE